MKRLGAKQAKPEGLLKVRVLFVTAALLCLFVAILARAFHLQVIGSDPYKQRADDQHIASITLNSKRGDIYDRNSSELAVSVNVDSVYAKPAEIKSVRSAAKKLSAVLGVKVSKIEKKLRSKRDFVWLKRQIDLAAKSREEILSIEGINLVKEPRRFYPNNSLASNLIGFTGVDSVGLEGLELYYDDVLRGSARKVTGYRDAKGRLLMYEDADKAFPIEGLRVELTIDKTIQYIVEKELKAAIESSGSLGGMAIVMNPETGEVLALANAPTFDPNNYRKYTPAEWRNKSVTDVSEPGSVMKAFVMAAAIEEGVVEPNDILFCENGKYRVANRTIHDSKKHGWLSVTQILKYSSNIGTLKIGRKLGPERLYRYLRAFGFADKTGLDLPGEASGRLAHYSDWSRVTLETISFGQGISTTGVQLTTAFSAIANGGFLMRPYIVKAVVDPRGETVRETNPAIVRRVISSETAKTVTKMLIGVTEEGGTGTRAASASFDVAGKTGTAQKPDLVNGGYQKKGYIASFIGFVPALNPKLVIYVALDEPAGDNYHGGTIAGPVFSAIAGQSLSYMGIFPDNPITGPMAEKAELRFRLASADMSELKIKKQKVLLEKGSLAERAARELEKVEMPDFTSRSMRAVLRAALSAGVEVEFRGSGNSYNQKPAPGRLLTGDDSVVVWFR